MKQLLILCMALFAISCSDEIEIYPSGKLVKETRSVASFSSIEVSNGISLTLSQGTNDVIVIEADDNIIQYVETYTRSEKLFLEIKDGIDIQSTGIKKTLNVSVSTPTLSSLLASGGSEIRFVPSFHLSNLDMIASGGINITGELNLTNLSCSISGGSRILLNGSTNKLHVTATGGSEYHLYSLTSQDAEVDISGGSIAELNATNTLRVSNASGGSKIYYKGDAQITELNLSGGSTILKQ